MTRGPRISPSTGAMSRMKSKLSLWLEVALTVFATLTRSSV
jgi:hypothetical protein